MHCRSPGAMAPHFNRLPKVLGRDPGRDLCHVFIKFHVSVKCESKKLELSSIPTNGITFGAPQKTVSLLLNNKHLSFLATYITIQPKDSISQHPCRNGQMISFS